MVCWQFPFEENYKGAYTAKMFNLGKLRDVFHGGVISSDFEGLLGMQTILAVIEVLMFSKQQLQRLSFEVCLQILEQLSDMLKTWEPLTFINPDIDLEQIWSLNFPNCFEVLIDSVGKGISRLVHSLDERQPRIGEESYLLHLAAIKEQMERIREVMRSAFASFPSFPTDESDTFHFKMINVYRNKDLFLFTNRTMLKLFVWCKLAYHLVTIPVNSQIASKVKEITYYDLITSSTDEICPICYDSLDGGQTLAFRVGCNHICCSHCMDTWFETLTENNSDW